jgi:uncharacterized UBP type Zn finger protein
MIWSIDLDDFNGQCSETPYPLTRLVLSNLQSIDRKKCMPMAKVNDDDIDAYLSKVYKWIPSSNELIEDSMEKLRTFTLNASFHNHRQHGNYNQVQPVQKQFIISSNQDAQSTTKWLFQSEEITDSQSQESSTSTTSTTTSISTAASTSTKPIITTKPTRSPIYDIDYR